MRTISMMLAVAVGVIAAPVAAQGVFDLGALAKSVAAGPSATPMQTGTATQPPSANDLAKLTFQPNMAVRKDIYQTFANSFKTINPEVGAQMEAAFSQMDLIEQAKPAIAGYGLKTNDIADAYTMYLISAWMGANGRTDDMTQAQISGVQTMVRTTLGSSKELLAQKEENKQRFGELMLITAIMNGAMTDAVANDPALKTKTMADIKAGAKEMGIDVDTFELTPDGLKRK